MSLSVVTYDPAVAGLGLLDEEGGLPFLATAYAQQTRDFLGVPAEFAFALNESAAAAVSAMMARRGMVPPPGAVFCPRPAETAEITLYNDAAQVVARITFDTRGAGSMDEIEAWLERTQSGDRLLDLGVDIVREPAATAEMARGVAGRLWDALAG